MRGTESSSWWLSSFSPVHHDEAYFALSASDAGGPLYQLEERDAITPLLKSLDLASSSLGGLERVTDLIQGRRSLVACPWLSYFAPLALS
jgi:hypothetical protein